MFRPARVASACQAFVKSPLFPLCRFKVIYVESYLDKAERVKLWNKENKLLFGPLLETQKAKAKRTKVSKSVKTEIHDLINGTKSLKLKATKKPKKFDMKTVQVPSFLYNVENKIFSKKTGSSSRIELMNTSNILSTIDRPHVKLGASNPNNSILTNSNFVVPSIIKRNLKTFPMMRSQKVDLDDKKSDILNDGKILRITSAGQEYTKFPSVTKILEISMSEEAKAALERWKQKKIEELGLEGFEIFNRAQMDHGKQFHSLLSDHFLSTFNTSKIDSSLEGVWTSVSHVLKELSAPKAIESHVVHPVLKYKGVIDCIASFQDKPTLIEWKKSDKPKPALSATYDNPVQLAAYFGAISHDINYKQLNVKDALLVIAYTDGTPADIFHLNVEQMRKHWADWLTRLEKFFTTTEIKDTTPK